MSPDWFQGFNDAAEKHIRDSIPLLATAAELAPCESLAVQAGGCYGLYPWLLSEWFERVVTFEPTRESYMVLCHNLRGTSNVTAIWGALLHEAGECSMHECATNPGGNSVVAGKGLVTTVRLDDQLATHGMPVGLIQLDVEGSELAALIGARRIIDRDHPVIMYEHCHDNRMRVWHHLRGMGYEILEKTQTDILMTYRG